VGKPKIEECEMVVPLLEGLQSAAELSCCQMSYIPLVLGPLNKWCTVGEKSLGSCWAFPYSGSEVIPPSEQQFLLQRVKGYTNYNKTININVTTDYSNNL
jgi:hypothetical protein